MTPDLFAPEIPGVPPVEPRRTPKKGFRGSQSPKVEPRNPGSRESRGKTPETPGYLPGSGGSLQDIRTRRRLPDLISERKRLEKEIEGARDEYERAHLAQQPYQLAFRSAHQRLEGLHADRKAGASISQPLLLAAYDCRVAAGHAWHPFRVVADDLARWVRRLREDLVAVNKEIGT